MSRVKQIEARYAAAWHNDPPKRYLPQAINGGPAWKVFDTVKGLFLNDSELLAVPVEEIQSEVRA